MNEKIKGHWECRQHGKECQSYALGWAEELNRKRVTPDTIPEEDRKLDVEKVLRYVSD